MRDQVSALADGMARRISADVEVYESARLVSFDELSNSCRAHLEFMLTSIGGGVVDASAAHATGRRRAEQGLPLSEIMSAYRIGSRFLWDAIVSDAAGSGIASDALIRAASDIWELQSVYTEAMSTSYRDVQASQLLAQEQERSALVAALLEGRTGRVTLWEVADLLRLPQHGPYVVVAAEVPKPGRQALTEIEERLGQAGLASAWRLLPDMQVGVVRFPDDTLLERLVVELRQRATHRVGVSPAFEELNHTATALRLARIALTGSTPDAWVTVYDQVPLHIAAVSDPEVMSLFFHNVLGGLDGLPRDERIILLDTFRAWLDCKGSANDTAERLFCHPNTVRHRLRRIEKSTGRSVNEPRALAELCLAIEAERRLG
jgi:hypothetical protein